MQQGSRATSVHHGQGGLDMSSELPQVHGDIQRSTPVWQPASNCALCRIGQMTVPCVDGDVRALDSDPTQRLYRNNVVQGEGPTPCPVMFIGEAPGFQEDRDGHPFNPSAPAGRMLAAAMFEVGFQRQYAPGDWHMTHPVYMTNTVHCRPEDNKLSRFPDGLEICRSTFQANEIAVVQPKVIVCLGKTAALPWFGKQGSLAFRWVPRYAEDQVVQGNEQYNVLFIHAPHPSFVARTGSHASPAYGQLVDAMRMAMRVGYPTS